MGLRREGVSMDFVNSILELHLGSKVYHPNSTKFSSDGSKHFWDQMYVL